MEVRSRDTSPEAERVQIELLRKVSPARRFEIVRSLTRTVVGLARRGIRRTNPDASDTEILLLFVENHYGSGLATRVRRYLSERERESP